MEETTLPPLDQNPLVGWTGSILAAQKIIVFMKSVYMTYFATLQTVISKLNPFETSDFQSQT